MSKERSRGCSEALKSWVVSYLKLNTNTVLSQEVKRKFTDYGVGDRSHVKLVFETEAVSPVISYAFEST